MDRRRGLIEETVCRLAALPRPSASEGERRAAEWIAERLQALGCDARVEREEAHGGYWWPLGLPNALALAAGLWAARRPGSPLRRLGAALAGGLAAAAVWDDTGGGRLWFRRLALPHRPTWNVVGELGDRDAERTIAFVAHHDAAHTGLVFHPALPRLGMRLFPGAHARASHTIPVLYGVWLGPAAIAAGGGAGSRRTLIAGAAITAGAVAAMADIGRRGVVPGANDNLSAVAVLAALADTLRERRIEGVRVLLVSTGSEESFMEGMQGFLRRHRAALSPESTEVVCLECLGSPKLIVLEGEGMLRMRDYPVAMRDELARAAAEAGVEIGRGVRTVAATDALVALRAGYSAVTLGAIDETKFPSNYHWPTDTPDNLSWGTIVAAVDVCEAYLRRRARAAQSEDRRMLAESGA